jgi:hypothetical protein
MVGDHMGILGAVVFFFLLQTWFCLAKLPSIAIYSGKKEYCLQKRTNTHNLVARSN